MNCLRRIRRQGYRNKLATESLEQRHLLTAVMSLTPAVGDSNSELPVISVKFDSDIDANSVSAESLLVYGSQSGRLPYASEVAGPELTLSMSNLFLPGETVQVTITTQVASIDGEPLERAYVGEFLARVKNGTGVFADADSTITWDVRFVDPVNWSRLPVDASLADLDGDGDLDVFLASDADVGAPNRVWMNDGNGHFADSQQELGNFASASVTLGDIDGDGDVDAFVGNSWPHPAVRNPPAPADKVWLNDGNGMFADSGQFLGEMRTRDVALGDLDGDGDLDAISATQGDGNAVWLNDGSGNFSSGRVFGSDGEDVGHRITLELGDVDLDGDLDAMITSAQAGVKVFLNDGSGRFRAGGRFDASGNEGLALGDLDNDDDLDVLLVSYESPTQVWLNDGQGNFLDSKQPLGTARGAAVSVGDFDGDGDLDAFVVNHALRTDDGWTGTNEIWLNDGLGNFAHSVQTGVELGDSGFSNALALGDLDGDGDLDALVDNRDELKVLLNQDQSATSGDFEGDGSSQLGSPSLVHDTNPTPSMGSDPRSIVELNGDIYYVANDGEGNYLWHTDRTTGVTRRVSDVRVGWQQSFFDGVEVIEYDLVKIEDSLFFIGDDGKNGRQLWKSDGTDAGTKLFKDFQPNDNDSNLRTLTAFGGTLYFVLSQGNFSDLWQSDGTIEGTVPVVERLALPWYGPPLPLTEFQERLFFVANIDEDRGLWTSDGTVEDTHFLKEASFRRPCSDGKEDCPQLTYNTLTETNEALYYATDVLWKTDGTIEGTLQLTDEQSGFVYPSNLTSVGETIFFVNGWNDRSPHGGRGELWKSDGTSEGTVLVKDIYSGDLTSDPQDLTNVDGVVYFSANDGLSGRELWRSDGTPEGTRRVKNIWPGTGSSNPTNLHNVDGLLWFSAENGAGEAKLWTSDGTESGTRMVPSEVSAPDDFLLVDDELYFSAWTEANGRELWSMQLNPDDAIQGDLDGDGVVGAGDIDLLFAAIRDSSSVARLDLDSNGAVDDFDVSFLTETVLQTVRGDVNLDGQVAFDDFLVLSANFEKGSSATREDGDLNGDQVVNFADFLFLAADFGKDSATQDSPVPLDLIGGSEGASPRQLTSVGDDLYFTTSEGLWKTDGSLENTVKVSEAWASDLTAVDETLYFFVHISTSELVSFSEPHVITRELWKTDGSGGTVRVKRFTEFSNPLCQTDGCRGPRRTASLDGKLYFTNYGRSEFGFDVWGSDGTEEGTTILDGVSKLIEVDGTALFATSNQWWRSFDDTAERVQVPDDALFYKTGYVGDTLYFVSDSLGGPVIFERVLWKTDFTQSEAVRVAYVAANFGPESPIELTGGDATLYFVKDLGRQLWKSDGTDAGTVLVRDFETQRLWDLTTVDAAVYFWTRSDQEYSLWTSDGTADGTVKLDEFQSAPKNLTAVGEALYFTSYDSFSEASALWISDGTVEGTEPVTTDASSPSDLHWYEDLLFFVAENEIVGRELWSLDVIPTI